MKTQHPIILGIVGDSAVGKTTITNGLVRLLGADRVTHICTDDYHKYDRYERARLNISVLHPDCNYLDILEQHLERLRSGQPILKPVYDHSTGTLARPEYVTPREFVIVEGLYGFHNPAIRQLFDVKVYVEVPESLRRLWKIRRDTTRRGYTPEQVIAELQKRKADAMRYIRPQRQYADIVVQSAPATTDQANGPLDMRLLLRPTIRHIDLDYLGTPELQAQGSVRLRAVYKHGLPFMIVDIDGCMALDAAAALKQMIWEHLPSPNRLLAQQLGTYEDRSGLSHSDSLALTQFLLAAYLLRGRVSPPSRLRVPFVMAWSRINTTRRRITTVGQQMQLDLANTVRGLDLHTLRAQVREEVVNTARALGVRTRRSFTGPRTSDRR